MARKNAVYSLPPDVRGKLAEQIVRNGFSRYEALSEWLDTQGFSVSKSAIHRFAETFKPEDGNIAALEGKVTQSAFFIYDLRMRCVESAVNSGSNDVLTQAQSYFDWVTRK